MDPVQEIKEKFAQLLENPTSGSIAEIFDIVHNNVGKIDAEEMTASLREVVDARMQKQTEVLHKAVEEYFGELKGELKES